MDGIDYLVIASGAGVIGTYLWMDYMASRPTTSLADTIEESNLFKSDSQQTDIQQKEKELLRHDVARIVSVFGPFTYFAKMHYKDVVSQK